MIDNLVDNALATLLRASLTGIAGLSVVTGIQDNMPDLETPYLVIYSDIEKAEANKPVFTLKTIIEYVTLSGIEGQATIQTTMTAVDAALSNTPLPAIEAQVVTTGLRYLAWQAIERSQENVGDRRKNVRELTVFAEPV